MSAKLRIFLLTAIALLALVLGYLVTALLNQSSNLNTSTKVCQPAEVTSVISRFNLIDDNGNPVTEASYKGKYKLISFGFTNCPSICPNQLSDLNDALEIAKIPNDKLVNLFITLDPERDGYMELNDYLNSFPKFTGLTGSISQVQKAAKTHKVIFNKVADPESEVEYTIDHTTYAWLIGPDNKSIMLIPNQIDLKCLATSLSKVIL